MKEDKVFKKEMEDDWIPVHINCARDATHFWNWSSDSRGWMRGKKIPEYLNRAYKNPITKSNYK